MGGLFQGVGYRVWASGLAGGYSKLWLTNMTSAPIAGGYSIEFVIGEMGLEDAIACFAVNSAVPAIG